MALPCDPASTAGRFWTEPREHLVRRLVRNRLPAESILVDACWRPGSPLATLAGTYPMLACIAPGTEALPETVRWPGPTVRAGLGRLPLADDSVDGVLLLDVIERLDDDRAPLVEAGRALRSGGMVIVTAPAGPNLWSTHDERSGHRRRYTGDDLTALLRAAGLLPEAMHHFQCLLYPLFAANRRRARRRPEALAWEQRPPPLVDRVLGAVNRFEVATAGRVPWPRGTSLLVVGRKP